MAQSVTGAQIRTRLDARLAGAYRTLESSLNDSVGAVTYVVPLGGGDSAPSALWQEAARLAEARNLDVEMSANGTHMRIRFSRRDGERP